MAIDILADMGTGALAGALALSLYAMLTAAIAAASNRVLLWRSAARAIHAIAFLTTLALGLQVALFAARAFQFAYVASNTSRDLPLVYAVAALWAGEDGSLLLWTWALALCAWIATRASANPRLVHTAVAILGGIQIFFLWLVLQAQPFALLAFAPTNGQGLNPILQTPWMYRHPLPLYLGLAALAVPFAFALAALLTGQLDDGWARAARGWAIAGWLLLTLAIVFGAQWAVRADGWGGYWGWDPVENAALLPWLAVVAFFHSRMATERRGMLKRWTLALAGTTFGFALVGAFISRGGIVPSIHAFGSTGRGDAFLYLAAFALVVFFALLLFRWRDLRGAHTPRLFARESTLSWTNWTLTALAFLELAASVTPWWTRLMGAREIVLSATFYNHATAPLWSALLVSMGVCPLVGFGARASGKTLRALAVPLASAAIGAALGLLIAADGWRSALFGLGGFVLASTWDDFGRGLAARWRKGERNIIFSFAGLVAQSRRHYGGYLAHIGIVFMALGLASGEELIWAGLAILTVGTLVAVLPIQQRIKEKRINEFIRVSPIRVVLSPHELGNPE
ncbi:MAG: cytochrome c biogenesis protein CcsA [Chloroflexi bacterium]|nr:cytochrome c biogenesis protein CcsA [Chloroflexota bacterium]